MISLPTCYKDLSWHQMWHLRSTAEKNLTGFTDSYEFRKQVYTWRETVVKIQNSAFVKTSFFEWIKDLVSLRIIKKWIVIVLVRRELQHIDLKISDISYYLFYNKKLKNSLEAKAAITKAHQYFQDHKDTLLHPVVAAQQALGAIRPQGTPTELEAKVNQFFQEKIARVQQGHTTLPDWYHATKTHEEGLLQIFQSQQLYAFNAPAGRGVYVSSQYETSYGCYGLAFDSQAVEKLPAQYFLWADDRFWVQIESCVPLDPKTISHIVVPTEAHTKPFLQKLQQANITQLAQLPIIDLDTNLIVSVCFAKTTPRILPPSPCWKPHEWHLKNPSSSNKQLPQDFQTLFFLEHQA